MLGRHSVADPCRFHSLSKHVGINEGVATECHPYKLHSLSKHVAIKEGVATECHPYKFHSLSKHVAINEAVDGFRTEVPLAARHSRDDATLFTDSYFRRDG
jgi:hypothetical protein